jgi:hypothetical protein
MLPYEVAGQDHDERGDQPTLVDEALELIVRMPAGAGRGRA